MSQPYISKIENREKKKNKLYFSSNRKVVKECQFEVQEVVQFILLKLGREGIYILF